MSIRFAGSKCVDERRRRRLAQEADAALDSVVRAPAAPAGDTSCRLPRGSSPVDSLISPRLWKHIAVATLAFLAWGAVLVIGIRADQAAEGLESIVGLAAGKLTRFFSTVMLLTAGQLAFINLWYRSRSRKDFSGSYKLWFHAAVGWLTLCAFQATGAHWNFADALLAGRPIAVWNARLLAWLIPAAIIAAALYPLLLREMRDCRLSLWTLRLSGIAAAASGMLLVFGPFIAAPQTELLASTAAATLWHLSLALAMLFHARHVIHVSNEPPLCPIIRRTWPRPSLAWLRGWSRSPRPITGADGDRRPQRTAKPKRTAAARKVEPVEPDGAAELPAESDLVGQERTTSRLPSSSDDDSRVETVTPSRAATSRPAPTAAAPLPSAPTPAPIRRVDPPQSVSPAKASKAIARGSVQAENATESEWDDNGRDDGGRSPLSKKERRRLKKLSHGSER